MMAETFNPFSQYLKYRTFLKAVVEFKHETQRPAHMPQ